MLHHLAQPGTEERLWFGILGSGGSIFFIPGNIVSKAFVMEEQGLLLSMSLDVFDVFFAETS